MPNATNDEPAHENDDLGLVPRRLELSQVQGDRHAVGTAPYARGRAEPSGIVLTEADAEIVKGMLRRGDRQQDIAAWFGVNQGRVNDIEWGRNFPNAPTASEDRLPPPGPYPGWRTATSALEALAEAKRAIEAAEKLLLSGKDQ